MLAVNFERCVGNKTAVAVIFPTVPVLVTNDNILLAFLEGLKSVRTEGDRGLLGSSVAGSYKITCGVLVSLVELLVYKERASKMLYKDLLVVCSGNANITNSVIVNLVETYNVIACAKVSVKLPYSNVLLVAAADLEVSAVRSVEVSAGELVVALSVSAVLGLVCDIYILGNCVAVSVNIAFCAPEAPAVNEYIASCYSVVK